MVNTLSEYVTLPKGLHACVTSASPKLRRFISCLYIISNPDNIFLRSTDGKNLSLLPNCVNPSHICFAPCKVIQESPGLWILLCGFQIPGPGFWITPNWIPDSQNGRILDFSSG